MKRWLARRILAGLLLLGSVALAGGFWIDHSLAMAKDDAYIIDALGRQRMLSQAMGKSILSYAMARTVTRSWKTKSAPFPTFVMIERELVCIANSGNS